MAWTNEQKQAIEKSGANILVSAGAGSGKTTVLVARILNKIIKEKVNIDDLLVVTFTNAAASEMREKILNAIYEEIDKNPNDSNLQKQINLINQAHISTIHAFCLDVIRNNFFELGVSANFRVGDETEIEIMKQEAIEKVFENNYENHDKDFLDLIEKYTTYKDDQKLKDIILNMFEFISSVPFPEKWLNDAIEDYNINEKHDFSKTKWGKEIIECTQNAIENGIINLKNAKSLVENIPDLVKCNSIILDDIEDLESINFNNWNEAYEKINSKEWSRWPTISKISEDDKELKEKAKIIRDDVKTNFEKKIKSYFKFSSEEVSADIREMYDVLKKLQKILNEFTDTFSQMKTEKNIVDFSDIEHMALKLLVNENGEKTEIAKNYNFNEILVDEYQDSNLIQEKILNSVSNGHNIFMVGDVKQSIYRFRKARPDLFLNKYNTYKKCEDNSNTLSEDTKILLYKNFRSDKSVIDFVNIVFQDLMSENVGEINYTDEEYLKQGKEEEQSSYNKQTEIYVIEKNQNEIEQTDEIDTLDEISYEAKFVAKRINELVQEGVNYKDIAILMRSVANTAPIFEKELMEAGIPVYSDAATNYLESIEIDTIISLLKVIDNPLQDIPLVTVLRSPIGELNDNDLIEIRLQKRDGPYYYAIKEFLNNKDKIENKALVDKVEYVSSLIEEFREEEKEIPLDELIWKIYSKTGYYYYVRMMVNGEQRQANLRKLFEKSKEYEKISLKGLYNFITFIEKVEAKKSSNLGDAKIIGENDNVVRIMSIHKSKGLEFPIVFIANAGKQFNMSDTKEKIIFDQDMGIGVNYVGNSIEYPTLTKSAINIKAVNEAVSEEMRILYVALTRAKSKLIIVGSAKNSYENFEKKTEEIEKFCTPHDEKIDSMLVAKYNTYLDWIELVYKYSKLHKEDSNVKLQFIKKESLPKAQEKQLQNIDLSFLKNKPNGAKLQKVDELLNWKYEFLDDTKMPTKTSVSALKNADLIFENGDVFVKKEFIENNKNKEKKFEINNDILTGEDSNDNLLPAQKGTLIHLVMQKLNDENIDETIEDLKIRKAEKEFLLNNKNVFENYLNSDLYSELKNAKEVKKETPFYLNVGVENSNSKILVQGIIDLYFVNQNNELILVDYKTDKNVDENLLKERYENQLKLYKIALEKSLQKPVKSINIYSTELNKLITIK